MKMHLNNFISSNHESLTDSDGYFVNLTNQWQSLFSQGVRHIETGNHVEAIELLTEALQIARELKIQVFELRSLLNLSLSHIRAHQFDLVFVYADEALILSQQLDHKEEESIIANLIGIAYGALGVNEEALNHFLHAVTISEKHEFENLYKIYNNLSNVYRTLNNHQGAYPYIKKALNLAIQHRDSWNEVACLINLGEYHYELNDFSNAKEFLMQALAEIAKLDDPDYSSLTVHQLLGDCFYAEDCIKAAEKHYLLGLEYLAKQDNSSLKSLLLPKLARVYIAKSDYTTALTSLKTASELCNSQTTQTYILIQKLYSDVYKKLGDFEKALEYHENYHILHQAVHDEAMKHRMQGMMMKFDVDRLHSEKELLEKEQQIIAVKNAELADLNKKLTEQNLIDSLTNVGNRRYLDQFLANEFEVAKISNRNISVIMCDVDYFKRINDNFSHAVGDEVLKTLGKLLNDNLRENDVVARYGGEEFVLVFPYTKKEHACRVAEKLRKIVETCDWGIITPELRVTMSFGIASGTEFQSYEKLLALADENLYKAKDAGRNKVVS